MARFGGPGELSSVPLVLPCLIDALCIELAVSAWSRRAGVFQVACGLGVFTTLLGVAALLMHHPRAAAAALLLAALLIPTGFGVVLNFIAVVLSASWLVIDRRHRRRPAPSA